MSVSRVSDECSGMDAEFVFGHVKVEPDHDNCSGGHTRPGILGGWVCSCLCHQTTARGVSSRADQTAHNGGTAP